MFNINKTPNRDSWEIYFMKLAIHVSSRSTCPRKRVGSVIVTEDNNIVSSGYNGSLSSLSSCDDVGCLIENNSCQRVIHSETNAILQCAKHGKSCKGCKIFVTLYPCFNCFKNIVNAGIKKIYYLEDYKNNPNIEIMSKELGIEIKKVEI